MLMLNVSSVILILIICCSNTMKACGQVPQWTVFVDVAFNK